MMEFEDNYVRVRDAAKELGAKDFILEVRRASFSLTPNAIVWAVSFSMGSGINPLNWEIKSAEDFATALSLAVEAVRKMPQRCSVCGGRLDGACKHYHAAESILADTSRNPDHAAV